MLSSANKRHGDDPEEGSPSKKTKNESKIITSLDRYELHMPSLFSTILIVFGCSLDTLPVIAEPSTTEAIKYV